jgi:drug/metabolite transporter (DMT)-like permease
MMPYPLSQRHVESSIELRRRGVYYLLFVTLIWGGTFVWMKQLLENAPIHLSVWDDKVVVSLFVAMRFIIAAILLFALLPKSRKAITNKATWKGGLYIAIPMYLGFIIQMFALTNISPAISAFLTSLYVIFTALIAILIGKQNLSLSLAFGVIVATIGAAILGLGADDSIFDIRLSGFGWASWATIFSALMFAIHIIVTDSVTKKFDPTDVSLTSFIFVALFSIISFLVVLFRSEYSLVELVRLFSFIDIIIPLLLLGGLGSLVALLVLNTWQRHLSPVHAAIIYSLEPIWALTYSLFSGLETITIWLFVGGGLLLCGNLVVELFIRKKEKLSKSS